MNERTNWIFMSRIILCISTGYRVLCLHCNIYSFRTNPLDISRHVWNFSRYFSTVIRLLIPRFFAAAVTMACGTLGSCGIVNGEYSGKVPQGFVNLKEAHIEEGVDSHTAGLTEENPEQMHQNHQIVTLLWKCLNWLTVLWWKAFWWEYLVGHFSWTVAEIE